MSHKTIIRILILAALPILFMACGKHSDENTGSKKTTGSSIVESGELAAINSKAFTLQRYGRNWYEMRIIGMIDHGTIVQPGDSLIQLDDADIKKYIIDRESELETELAAEQKMLIDHQNSKSETLSSIRSNEASFQLKTIELESSRFESERNRRIKELEYQQAQITLEKERRRLEFREVMNMNDLRIQRVKIQRLQNEIDNAYSILPQLTIRTPIAGVFQVGQYRNQFVKIGDVKYPGNLLANVPELSRMKVETFIGEMDFLKIYEDQSVIVRLDAMPNIAFNGKITYIGKLCRRRDWNSRQKGFDVVVEISDQDERLKPGMTVSCEFLDIR